MSVANFEPIFSRAGRRAIIAVLRAHPEWTLGQVCRELERDVPVAAVLRQLTLGELLDDPARESPELPPDGGPPVDPARLALARRSHGEGFDACVCEVLAEAEGRAVPSAYLRVRLGGPRSKLQASLRRLIAHGAVVRSGSTSATRYRLARPLPNPSTRERA